MKYKSPLSYCVSALAVLACAVAPHAAWSAKLYQITGEVTAFTKTTVSIRRAGENFQFSRPEHMGLLKKGDRITIHYKLDAKQIVAAPEDPGTVPEGETGPSERIILDDRAFYNAKVSSHHDQKNPG
jgi:hypothetical protein